MDKKVVIFGTGTLAEVAHFYLTHDSEFEVVAFTADKEYISSDTFNGKPLLPFNKINSDYSPAEYDMFVAVGYREVNEVRAKKFNQAKEKGYELISYVNSEVTEWGDTTIGENCFIFEDQTIQPFVDIGDNVIIWSGNHIGHHTTIHDHAFLTSHAVISGYVEIKPYAFIGVNATLRDEITIGKQSVIGAGATVITDTEEFSVYLGHPAEQYSEDSSDVNL
jgi:sugar O-acyltransferase (sialic acid O-acetyltransferase NeuD family)